MTPSDSFSLFSQSLADAVERAGASTVLVNARSRLPATGVVFGPGLVLTADHVVEREEDISIVFADGTELDAALAGRAPDSDLAVLKFAGSAQGLAIVQATRVRVGEIAVAIGRPTTSGLQASLGIVSALRSISWTPRRHRHGKPRQSSAESFIYTDAVPYPGFSGGPLVNAAGELLGLNTSGLVQGASLSIPVERALSIGAALAEHGSIKRGYLGIRSQATALDVVRQSQLGRSQEGGLLIVWMEDGSPAAAGGLLVGDILVSIDGVPVDDHDSLQSALSGKAVGASAQLETLRGEKAVQLAVTIAERKS